MPCTCRGGGYLGNFHDDPVTCAVAAGWAGATVKQERIRAVWDGEILRFVRGETGRVMELVTDIDAEDFTGTWLACVERAQAGT